MMFRHRNRKSTFSWRIRLTGERFEPRYNLSAIGFAAHDIVIGDARGAADVKAADLDGDGDLDVLSASQHDGKIAWYENVNGQGTFGEQRVITPHADGAVSVCAADWDGDGDQDVFSASWQDNKIAWYENMDGRGTFGPQRIITSGAQNAWSVYAADLDRDGDPDLLFASGRRIAWVENMDGLGTFGDPQLITTHVIGANTVYAADLDLDGDLDALSASWQDNKVAWYENTDSLGTFGPQQIITTIATNAWSVYAGDLNGDGRPDVLSASSGDDKVAWYENTDGQGVFGPQQIITTSALGAFSVHAADLDDDGDLDVLSASLHDVDKIAWYENLDGQGTFGPLQVITTRADGADTVLAADLDNDGDRDILSASVTDGKITWYENRPTGDSNDDGIFDSADLILVLQAGEFDDDFRGNSTFDEGDWNGDGDFDAVDIVFALQAGTYDPRKLR